MPSCLVVAESSAIVPLPDAVGMADAAAICDGALTALPFLRDGGHVRAGDACSSTALPAPSASAAVQLAKHLGAEVVGGLQAAHVELVRALGADHVDRPHPRGLHARRDRYSTCSSTRSASARSGARGACWRAAASTSRPCRRAAIMFRAAHARLGRDGGRVIMFTGLRKDADKVPDLDSSRRSLASRARFVPSIDRESCRSTRSPTAHRRVDGGHKAGSVVLRPVPEHAPRRRGGVDAAARPRRPSHEGDRAAAGTAGPRCSRSPRSRRRRRPTTRCSSGWQAVAVSVGDVLICAASRGRCGSRSAFGARSSR